MATTVRCLSSPLQQQFLVIGDCFRGADSDIEHLFGPSECRYAQSVAQVSIKSEPDQRRGCSVDGLIVEVQATDLIFDDLDKTAVGRDEYRQPSRECFDRASWEAFAGGDEGGGVGGGVDLGDIVTFGQKRDTLVEAEFRDKVAQHRFILTATG